MGQKCINTVKDNIDEISCLQNFINKNVDENNAILTDSEKKQFESNNNTEKEGNENENLNYKIYKLINDIRINPEKYEEKYNNNENIKETFENYVKSHKRPNKKLIFLQEDSDKISYYINDKKNNDKSSDEKNEDIYKLLGIINNDNVKFIRGMGKKDNVDFCVWEFFDSCDDDLNDVLFNDYDFIVVADVPIENTNKNYFYIILFNK